MTFGGIFYASSMDWTNETQIGLSDTDLIIYNHADRLRMVARLRTTTCNRPNSAAFLANQRKRSLGMAVSARHEASISTCAHA